MNLFKKAAVLTDIHFGLKSNSIQHNEDCIEFIEWFVEKAKQEGCETCFFLGDWNHHRASINIQTLQYSLKGLEILNNNFDKVYFIAGNHDLFYRDRRDISSVEWAKHLPNVKIIDDWFVTDDVVIAPWLVGDDAKKLAKMKGKYLFGHFELPAFYMNAQVLMPDHGDISDTHVSGFEKVFSGHFHKRQARKNIWYIGNAFPHNYADAGDDARGMMILEWDQEPEFHAWPNQPKYRVYNLSDVLDNPEGLLLPRTHVRIHIDVDISYEEASFIKETLIPQYNLREMTLIPVKGDSVSDDGAQADLKFESVDKIILEGISNIESDFYDTKLLLEIYQNT
jgi:DNA repair exonuclease SbcCD nuclease subunit